MKNETQATESEAEEGNQMVRSGLWGKTSVAASLRVSAI